MGLRSLIRNVTRTAFNVIGDIPVTATYHHTLWGDYEPATGSRVDTGDDETVSIVLTDFRQMEATQDEVQPGDKKGLIRQAALSLSNPDLDDYLIIAGITWHIIGFGSDPADATWTLHLRRA